MKLLVKIRRLVSTMLTVLVVATILWQMAPTINAQQHGTTMAWRNPASLIDERARALDPNDSSAVQGVADAIFNYPHVLGRMPAEVESSVKERLVRAEAEFLQGKRPGVREDDIVLVVNQVSDKFRLPDFAKTSKKQVRALRMKMALASPLFMGRGMADGEMKVGDSISHELSPLQATHLIGVLVDQKFLDPHFQLPPEQWDRESHAKEMERLREQQALSKSNPQVRLGAMARINPKRHDLQDAISQNTNSMGIGDALDLIDSAFRTLRIEP